MISTDVIAAILDELRALRAAQTYPTTPDHNWTTRALATIQALDSARETIVRHVSAALGHPAGSTQSTPWPPGDSTARVAEQPSLWDAPTSPTTE